MLVFAIILCYLLGLSVLLAISRKNSFAEIIGYSFLIGIGLESVFLFLLDVVNIHYSPGLLIGLNVLFIVGISGLNYKNLLQVKSEFKPPDLSVKHINLVALFLFCIMGYLFYIITAKCLFWPPAEHDTIGSFDKLGKLMAIEGRLKISLFQYHLEGAGGIYPPLFHSSFAYVYIFGAETSKIITTLFFFSLLATFYSLIKSYVGATASAIFTLMLMVTPELFSHAALSLDNMPTTAYVGAGALATFTWLDKRDKKYFWLGAIIMAFVIWIRSDTIVFIAAALLIVGVDFLRTKDFKNTAIYSGIIVAPFIIWTLYLKLKIGSIPAAKFDFSIGYNSVRMDMMKGYLKAFLFGGQYFANDSPSHSGVDGGQLYGLSFLLLFGLIFVNVIIIVVHIVRKNNGAAKIVAMDKMNVLLFFFTSLTLYFLIFYFINVKVQNAPLYSLMESSFKRGMFCFLPIALFYIATNSASVWAFNRLEKFRNPAP